MPIYEFKCHTCGQVFEVFWQSRKSYIQLQCPECGSQTTEKILSSPARVGVESSSPKGTTCCGRSERCDSPPCSTTGSCRRD
ncbi:MAG: hypothetical protein B5M54_04905 [Candidatus Aminicenantes bacterium 4484_214]|nr:MAG: hypothetical protein B5M54_04905 [Candidatus Aminicenantes bacterium 4484_214]HDJ23093.1 zinc ribbon domain-containing protein [Candidatus Aminicenantes bacterium]